MSHPVEVALTLFAAVWTMRYACARFERRWQRALEALRRESSTTA